MPMNIIEPATLSLVSKALDAAALRQTVHAHNIANVHVDGFTPMQVRFEEQLALVRSTLERGASLTAADLSNVAASVEPQPHAGPVELDREVATLSTNSLHYQALVKALDHQLSLVSMAVSDGRR